MLAPGNEKLLSSSVILPEITPVLCAFTVQLAPINNSNNNFFIF
jgi:hypothetical protein